MYLSASISLDQEISLLMLKIRMKILLGIENRSLALPKDIDTGDLSFESKSLPSGLMLSF